MIIKLKKLYTAILIQGHQLYCQFGFVVVIALVVPTGIQRINKTLVGFRVNFSRTKSRPVYPICSAVSNDYVANLGGEQVYVGDL